MTFKQRCINFPATISLHVHAAPHRVSAGLRAGLRGVPVRGGPAALTARDTAQLLRRNGGIILEIIALLSVLSLIVWGSGSSGFFGFPAANTRTAAAPELDTRKLFQRCASNLQTAADSDLVPLTQCGLWPVGGALRYLQNIQGGL